MKRSNTMMAAFLGPALLSFILVYLYPTLRTCVMSLFRIRNVTDRFSKWEYVGIENYKRLKDSILFKTSLSNIFQIWLIGGLIILVSAMIYAVILTSGVRYKRFFRGIIYLPNIVSAVALSTMWIQYVYNVKYGMLKTFFAGVGLKGLTATEWTSPDNLLMAMIVAYTYGMIGYFMLIFMAGIEKIPIDYYEAATIEGAGVLKRFVKITVPLIYSIIRTSVVLWSINALTFFVWTQMFSPLTPEMGTITPMMYMYITVFGRNQAVTDPNLMNAGAGSAVGVILTLLVVVVFGGINLIMREKKLEY